MKTKSLLVGMATLLLGACATIGHEFDAKAADRFVVGQTTMSDAKIALGEPGHIVRNTEGRTKMIWSYTSASGFGVRQKLLGVVFDEKGRFLRISDEVNQ